MTKARDISDLLDANGDVKSGALDNVPPSNDASALTTGTIDNARISLDANEIPNLDTAKITTGTFADARMPSTVLNSNVDLTNLSASNLTSGTLPDARFPSTLPAVSGANLTNIQGGTNTPAFDAYLNGNQSISDGVITKVQFDTEFFDTDGDYDASTNYRFTPTTAGKYYVSSLIKAEATSDVISNVSLYIYKNGSSIRRSVFYSAWLWNRNRKLFQQM
jgi:hypothetical protein